MEYWSIWIGAGIVCILIEVFIPKYYLLSIGIGAIVAGLFAYTNINIIAQAVTFVAVSLISLLWIKKVSKKTFDTVSDSTNSHHLIGQAATVEEKIAPHKSGYINVKGQEWPAIGDENQTLEKETIVLITGVRDDKLIVREEHDLSKD